MNKQGSESVDVVLGFLSAFQFAGTGTVGALLVLNARARPLEFHCTAPIQPSRTQQILYGATLQPYLYGEEIAVALLKRARARLTLAITNEEPMLAARFLWDRPILLLADHHGASAGGQEDPSNAVPDPVDAPGPARGEVLQPFRIGPFRCSCCAAYAADAAVAASLWDKSAPFDLVEPFDRLREAVEESHRSQAA